MLELLINSVCGHEVLCAARIELHYVVSAPRRYEHLHVFKQQCFNNNTTSNRAKPHSANTALDTPFILRMRTIQVSLT